MPTYALNPYVSFVESRLFAEFVQHAVFHRLTGEIFEANRPALTRADLLPVGTKIVIPSRESEATVLTGSGSAAAER